MVKKLGIMMINIALLLGIMMISSISATLSFNNYADFKQNVGSRYGTIDVYDGNIIFPDEKIASYVLQNNTDYCLANCFADGIATLFKDGTLFESIKFETLGKRLTSIQSSKFYIKTGTEEYQEDIADYKESCRDVNLNKSNQPIIKCFNDIVGYHKEIRIRDVYKEYNGEILKAGTYEWKLNGKKDPAQTVDWIATTNNVELKAWSVWASGLNANIIHYWKLDTGNATSTPDSLFRSNGTMVNGDPYNITGKIKDSYYFGNLAINYSNTYTKALNRNWTLNMWIYGGTSAGGYAEYLTSGITGENGWALTGGGSGGTRLIMTKPGVIETTCGSSTALNSGAWTMITVVYEANNSCTMYSNGTVVASVNDGTVYGSTSNVAFIGSYVGAKINARIDEVGIWNRSLTFSEIQDLYNNSLGISYTNVFDSITTTLNAPLNDTKTNNSLIAFNYTITPVSLNITNWTLNVWYINGTLAHQHVNTTIFTNETITIIHNDTLFFDEKYYWNVYSCGNGISGSKCSWDSINRTFQIHSQLPTITLNSLPNVSTTSLPVNATLNVTSSDVFLSTCWYITSDNATTQIYTCNSTQNISFATGGAKTITAYANDTFGNTNSSTFSFNIYDFSYSQSGSASAGEGSSQTFSFILNSNSFAIGDADAGLWYGGVNKGVTTKTVLNSTAIEFSNTFVIPNGTGNSTGKNVSWFWNYNATQLTTRNSTTQLQTVYNVSISDCAIASGYTILNLTLKDEELNSLVNVTAPNLATIELDLEITSLANSSLVWEFSKKWLNNQTVSVCVPNGLLNLTTYRIDFTVGYDATDKVREFFYMDNGTLDNTNYFNSYTIHQIDLMDLATADSTTFLFEYTDADNQEVDDIIVHTFRKYIGEGLFREVERSKQDNAGQTHVHLVEEDVIYYFMITQYGHIIFTSDTYNAKCLSTPCEISLSASATDVNWSLTDNEGGNYAVATNKATRIVTTTFSLDAIGLVNVSLYKFMNGTETLLNSSSLSATSGTINLYVPLSYGNSTFFVAIYRDGTFIKSQWVDLVESGKDYFGTLGAILGGLVVLAIILMAVTEGAGFIVFTVLALIVISIMGLVDLGWMAIISIACAGGIIVWKLVNRRNKPN